MDSNFISRQERTNNARDVIAELMKETYGEGVDMGSNKDIITATPPLPKLENLSENVMLRIFSNLTNVHDYDNPATVEKIVHGYGAQNKEMTKFVWRMSGVCASFNHFFNNLSDKMLAQFPRPPIGLRIQPKAAKIAMKHMDAQEDPKVQLYVYGYFSKNNYVMCCKPNEIAAVLYPAIVETHLIIQSFVLDDGLIEMIQGFDTSKVEEVFFNDIMGVDLVEVSVADIVNLFPNAMMIRFLGDSRFESLITINNAEVPEMEKTTLDSILPGDLIGTYHDIDVRCQKRNKITRNRHRLVRETEALGDPQPLKKDDDEVQHKSLKRLTSYLNCPPKKRSPDELNTQVKIHELEKELSALRSRFSKLERTT